MNIKMLINTLKSKTLNGYISFVKTIDTAGSLEREPVCVNDKASDGKELTETTLTAICEKNSVHNELIRKYSPEKIACGETDFDRTKKLLDWLTENTSYSGIKTKQLTDNSVDLLDYSFGKPFRYAINCREKAIVFADCLVTAGIKAYPVCLRSQKFSDCHFVCRVYLGELQKWCAFDPSFGCYFTDERGNLLDIFEIRDLFIGGKEPTVCGYNFNGTTECFNVYMNGFLKYCCSNLSTWADNSTELRNGKKYSEKKKFCSKIPE